MLFEEAGSSLYICTFTRQFEFKSRKSYLLIFNRLPWKNKVGEIPLDRKKMSKFKRFLKATYLLSVKSITIAIPCDRNDL